MNRKVVSLILTAAMAATLLSGCGSSSSGSAGSAKTDAGSSTSSTESAAPAATEAATQKEAAEDLTGIDAIIAQAQTMSAEDLYKKAIEESNGKTFYGVGNSSRGKTALPLFIDHLKTIDPGYNMEFEWQQPKNNKIFEQLSADSLKDTGTFAMTLIQDGNQIQTKMVDTGILKTYIPKEWAEANGTTADAYDGFLPLQTLKLVGKNFLYMLTEDKYADMLKAAYDKLDDEHKAYFDPVIKELSQDAEDFGLGENGAYALAWIKLWVENYNAQTDDGPICNTLVDKSAKDQAGLLVYSKLRSVEESATVSVNNITVAAYQDGYTGIGGYGYCHYLFLTKNSPLPWTACAFIQYMTCTVDGFSAWGKDMGGYSANPEVAKQTEETYHHQTGGQDESGKDVYPAKDDRGYDWWTTTGELVLEDPQYCADAAFGVGSWIETLTKYADASK